MNSPTALVRTAATVVVARPGEGSGVEVLLLRRHTQSGFAADAWVFPGGVVEEADRRPDPCCWTGIDPEALTDRFGTPPDQVLALHLAAVREAFEEAGLLLACHAEGRSVDICDSGPRALRTELAGRGQAAALHRWLVDEGLVLDLGALQLWSRWITPPSEPKRYDTYFFLARAPEGQVACHDEVETTGQRWLTPRAALAAHASNDLHLIYPTITNLEEMVTFDTVGDLFAHAAARPQVTAVLPHFEQLPDGRWRVLHPGHPDYPAEQYAQELGLR